MAIQSAINQVLGTAAAFKTIDAKQKEQAAKTAKAQQKAHYKEMGNKLMQKFNLAKKKAMQEAEVRKMQREGYMQKHSSFHLKEDFLR